MTTPKPREEELLSVLHTCYVELCSLKESFFSESAELACITRRIEGLTGWEDE